MLRRIIDLLLAIFLMTIALPFLLLGYFLGFRMFKTVRIGRYQVPFKLYKIKTMRDLLPNEDPYHSEADRITPIGRWLRLTALDEWPQWWNVLKGEMSIIGPRPLPLDFLEFIPKEYQVRFRVKPGLTGWAQVNGRNSISFQKKLELDCWYVEHRNWLIDLKILFLTPLAILNHKLNPDRSPFKTDLHS